MVIGRIGQEWLARVLVLALIVGLPVGLWGVYGVPENTVEIHALMPETGGWSPNTLTVEAGQPLHLHLTSDDVLHGFAVGITDWEAIDVKPGQVTDLTLTFGDPGMYTFYCTRWCGPNHWRMRGTIIVNETKNIPAQTDAQIPPLYVTLDLDLDAPRPASMTPVQPPAVTRGAVWGELVPARFLTPDYYRSHNPAETWEAFRQEDVFAPLTDEEVWDVVAWVWAQNTTPEALQTGATLYAQNCAACHGETGAGDGVFAEMPGIADMPRPATFVLPTAFSAPETLLGASPALLQGKIIRGGMGTGMPYWGTIFTEEQTWALVSFLYSFQFVEE